MTIEDVKKIAIEEYAIREENLVLEQDGDVFHFCDKNSDCSYTVLNGIVLVDPWQMLIKIKGILKMKSAKKIYFFLAGIFLAFDFTGLIGLNLLPKEPEQKRKTDTENLASDWEKILK